MSEQSEKLRETVRELEEELSALDSVDEESRLVLEQALGEILEKLVDQRSLEEASDEEPIGDRLAAATEHWEAQHPRLTNLLDRLIAGLNQLGI
jgi:hypothetical protein